ncbi:GNAT family acetyltransferase [Arthrobacter tecti]
MLITDLQPPHYDDAARLWEAAGLTRPWNDPKADLLRAVQSPSSTVLGVVINNELACTAMVGHDGHRGWVYYLAVAEDRRGEGLGRLMMDACEQWLRRQGAVKVQLMIRETNTEVLNFYERLGYERSDVEVRAKWLTTDA